jgi:hypothetical protein
MCGFGDCIKGKLNSGAKVEGRDRRGDVSRRGNRSGVQWSNRKLFSIQMIAGFCEITTKSINFQTMT